MKRKFYLQTWFICLMFFLSVSCISVPPMSIFFIIGIVLIVLQNKEDKKYFSTYGQYKELKDSIQTLEHEHTQRLQALQSEYSQKNQSLQNEFDQKKQLLQNEFERLRAEADSFERQNMIKHYKFSEYEGLSSEDCKNQLSILNNKELELIQLDNALIITSDSPKKVINDNKKQLLRCFNAECNNLLSSLKVKNIDSVRAKIVKSYETLNKIFTVDGVRLSEKLLEFKLEELNLLYSFELKREQEREQQKAIKEQMIEEEKVRREIERQKAKIEKDELQCNNEIKKLLNYMQKTSNDIEKQLYIDKIKELEAKLQQLNSDKENVLEREANARAGFVYVISNIGSFGDDIYKIGMTRRLEPMDRIKELSSASVPFEFDVHAMIFSDDAPELENILHKHFEKQRVNRVNLRKEFFHVSLDEIENIVKTNFNNTVTFTRVPVAEEYRQTLNIISSDN